MDTAVVHDIPCGTSGGAMLYFRKMEVVYQVRALV